MIAFPGMLEPAAIKAGMKVPDDYENYNKDEYFHWYDYCGFQLFVPVRWGNHWNNAEIIASIPEDELRKMNIIDLYNMGFYP